MKSGACRPLLLCAALAGSGMGQDVDKDFLRALGPEALPAALAAALERLETPRIQRHLAYLTAPQREGRGLGTRGLDATARQLAQLLKAAGIPPLGTSYLQPVPLRRVFPKSGTFSLSTHSGSFVFRADHDAVLPPVEPGILTAPLVYVGHGLQEPTLNHDDFRGLDVRGKIVVFLPGVPSGGPWQKPELLAKYASERPEDRYDSRLALLEKLGARAAVALEAGLDARIRAGKEPVGPTFLAPSGAPLSGELPLVRVTLTPTLQAQLPVGFEGAATLTTRGHLTTFTSFNVIGQLEGSDPALRHEAILLGAHMDHLGQPGGVLHPGADDNASGVAALLELSRILAQATIRPKRTTLIAFWTGEEEGKFGSGHYTRHPAWPLANTRAYLNLDMIGHPWTMAELQILTAEMGLNNAKAFLDGLDPAHFAEPGLSSEHRDLRPILVQAGRGTGMSLHLDWTDGRNGGSDYRDFARQQVPFVRFFGNYFPEYHRPGDTLDKLDPEQVRRMARLVLATAWLLADR